MPEGVVAKKPKVDKGKVERKGDGAYTRMARFFRESYIEVFKKAVWPTWPELQKFTWVVIFAVAVVGVWIAGWDYILTLFTKPLIFGGR
jgi:preprotein translocase subunit SecE